MPSDFIVHFIESSSYTSPAAPPKPHSSQAAGHAFVTHGERSCFYKCLHISPFYLHLPCDILLPTFIRSIPRSARAKRFRSIASPLSSPSNHGHPSISRELPSDVVAPKESCFPPLTTSSRHLCRSRSPRLPPRGKERRLRRRLRTTTSLSPEPPLRLTLGTPLRPTIVRATSPARPSQTPPAPPPQPPNPPRLRGRALLVPPARRKRISRHLRRPRAAWIRTMTF